MGLFEGKSTTERNKIIAAGVLGLVALIALYMAFGRGLFGSSTTAATKSSPTPRPSVVPPANTSDAAKLPTTSQQDFEYQTTPVLYNPSSSGAPDPGRNIFAFFEPPPPCTPGKDCPPPPTPKPTPTPIPPTPAPTPVMLIANVSPGLVYAGVKPFKFEVNGDYFTPDSRIYFNQAPMPTTFVSPQKLVTEIPTSQVAIEGARQVIVQTPNGAIYSNQLLMTVMPQPKPMFQYIGMIGRKRYNNDTAYLVEIGRTEPFAARLNDVIKGQFRLIDISPQELVFEDINLGFRHRVALAKPTTGGGGGAPVGPQPFDPNRGLIPGIPNNIQPYNPVQPAPRRSPGDKGDVDDDGGRP